MTFYAGTLGVALCVVLLAVGWWMARRARDPRAMASLVWAGVGTVVAVGVNQPIVSAVHERRPYQSIPHVLLLVSRSSDYGFPSDDATMAGAVAAGLCLVNRRVGITAWVVALLLAFSRVYAARTTRTTSSPVCCWGRPSSWSGTCLSARCSRQ